MRTPGALRIAAPLLLFAGVLALLRWLAGEPAWSLPLRVLAVFAVSTAAFRVFPWRAAFARVPPRSHLFTVALFLIFVRHFTVILAVEARGILQARALAVARRCGPGWFRSLAWALAAVFRVSLARAERFYAALWLRRLAE